jgi:glutathione synthase/RimK-type ligase-like ATP-grasp enzyme
MILICGISSEPPTRLVLEAAEKLGVQTWILNQRECAQSDCVVEISGGRLVGRLWTPAGEIGLEDVSGVYVRLTEWQTLPEYRGRGRRTPDGLSVAHARAFHEVFQEWLEAAPCLVMNRADASASNMSKPYQSQWIAESGFEVPDTLVTNDADALAAFRRRHRRVIFKSVSSIRSIVQELTPRYEKRLDQLRYLPTQFQELVEGTDVRVHVAGGRVLATEIRTDSVDYRYAGRDGEAVEMRATSLPPEIEEKCLRLSRDLDLPLCGIDLKRAEDGRYYCFEVNPSPAFSYYQGQTGQPIAEAIVESLAAGEGPSAAQGALVSNRSG